MRTKNHNGRPSCRVSSLGIAGIVIAALMLGAPTTSLAKGNPWVSALLQAMANKHNGGGSSNGGGPKNDQLPNGRPFQIIESRLQALQDENDEQNDKLEQLMEDLDEANGQIEDLEESLDIKCEEIAALQAKDEELMESIGSSLTEADLEALLADPIFLEDNFLTEEWAAIHDLLNLELQEEVDALNVIVLPVEDCLLDIETCVLDIIAPAP